MRSGETTLSIDFDTAEEVLDHLKKLVRERRVISFSVELPQDRPGRVTMVIRHSAAPLEPIDDVDTAPIRGGGNNEEPTDDG